MTTPHDSTQCGCPDCQRYNGALDIISEQAREIATLRARLARIEPVYEAAMAFYSDQAMHWRPTTDKAWEAWDELEGACAREAEGKGE